MPVHRTGEPEHQDRRAGTIDASLTSPRNKAHPRVPGVTPAVVRQRHRPAAVGVDLDHFQRPVAGGDVTVGQDRPVGRARSSNGGGAVGQGPGPAPAAGFPPACRRRRQYLDPAAGPRVQPADLAGDLGGGAGQSIAPTRATASARASPASRPAALDRRGRRPARPSTREHQRRPVERQPIVQFAGRLQFADRQLATARAPRRRPSSAPGG